MIRLGSLACPQPGGAATQRGTAILAVRTGRMPVPRCAKSSRPAKKIATCSTARQSRNAKFKIQDSRFKTVASRNLPKITTSCKLVLQGTRRVSVIFVFSLLQATENTARQSRNGEFQIQNLRPWLPENFARKATDDDLVLRRGKSSRNGSELLRMSTALPNFSAILFCSSALPSGRFVPSGVRT